MTLHCVSQLVFGIKTLKGVLLNKNIARRISVPHDQFKWDMKYFLQRSTEDPAYIEVLLKNEENDIQHAKMSIDLDELLKIVNLFYEGLKCGSEDMPKLQEALRFHFTEGIFFNIFWLSSLQKGMPQIFECFGRFPKGKSREFN